MDSRVRGNDAKVGCIVFPLGCAFEGQQMTDTVEVSVIWGEQLALLRPDNLSRS